MTDAILDKKRTRMLDWFKTNDIKLPNCITCDSCLDKSNCKFAFDPYNIDGDCLGDK